MWPLGSFCAGKRERKGENTPFSSLTLGDLLCVSVLDPVRILGSTRGWFPCLSPPTITVFPLLPFSDASFLFRLADLRGSVPLLSLAHGTEPFVGPLASPEMVFSCPELGVLTNLRFRDQGHFKAGMLHEFFLFGNIFWRIILVWWIFLRFSGMVFV